MSVEKDGVQGYEYQYLCSILIALNLLKANSPTNINNNKMMCPDNKTTYALAQRVADITGQPTKLVVENANKEEWECPKTFYPNEDA